MNHDETTRILETNQPTVDKKRTCPLPFPLSPYFSNFSNHSPSIKLPPISSLASSSPSTKTLAVFLQPWVCHPMRQWILCLCLREKTLRRSVRVSSDPPALRWSSVKSVTLHYSHLGHQIQESRRSWRRRSGNLKLSGNCRTNFLSKWCSIVSPGYFAWIWLDLHGSFHEILFQWLFREILSQFLGELG